MKQTSTGAKHIWTQFIDLDKEDIDRTKSAARCGFVERIHVSFSQSSSLGSRKAAFGDTTAIRLDKTTLFFKFRAPHDAKGRSDMLARVLFHSRRLCFVLYLMNFLSDQTRQYSCIPHSRQETSSGIGRRDGWRNAEIARYGAAIEYEPRRYSPYSMYSLSSSCFLLSKSHLRRLLGH